MTRRIPALGAQELAIMKVVWRLKDVSVREVYETLRERRPVAYTTVMTMMNTLEGKGYLKKALDGRAFRYRPAVPEQRVVTAWSRSSSSASSTDLRSAAGASGHCNRPVR